jgi:hypothetical protein
MFWWTSRKDKTTSGETAPPLTKRTLLIGYEKLARQFETQHLDDTPERRGLKRMGIASGTTGERTVSIPVSALRRMDFSHEPNRTATRRDQEADAGSQP